MEFCQSEKVGTLNLVKVFADCDNILSTVFLIIFLEY